jgi:hypothetical protein
VRDFGDVRSSLSTLERTRAQGPPVTAEFALDCPSVAMGSLLEFLWRTDRIRLRRGAVDYPRFRGRNQRANAKHRRLRKQLERCG